MRKSQGWIVVAAVVASCGVFQWAVAQNSGQQQYAGTRVAVVCVGRIIQSHTRFKAEMEGLKQRMQTASREFQARRNDVLKMEEQKKQLVPGSPDYNAKDEQITAEKTRLAVEFKKRDEDFMRENAQICYNVYAEIMDATRYHCQQRGCDVAIRVDDTKYDPQQPATLQPILGRNVVWFNQALDITDYVLADINRPANGGGAAGGAPNGTAGVPASPFNAGNNFQNGERR